jgi:Spy/CpxP family protein refolding chaperone
MNSRLRILLLLCGAAPVLLLMTLSGVCAHAADSTTQPTAQRGQGGPPPGTPPPGAIAPMLLERGRQIADQLQLSDDQKSKIDAIYAKAKTELQSMQAELSSAEPAERMQCVREFMESVRSDVGAVLTPQQKEQFARKLEEFRETLRNRAGATTRSGDRAATTRPGFERPGPDGRGASAFADRLRDNLQKLDLTDEQKTKIKELFEDVKTRSEALRMQVESGATDATDKLRQLFQDTRAQLGQILTQEQREKLRGLMGGPNGPGGGPGGSGDRRGEPGRPRPGQSSSPTSKSAMKTDMKSDDDTMMQDADKSKDKSSGKSKQADAQQVSAGPSLGEPAPVVALKKIDGSILQLSSLKGRVVVLEFGSYSCPAFRGRAASMDKLKLDYGNRAQFFVVYTKEAHAAGEWEVDRNKDEGISVEQSKTFDARKTLAATAKDKLGITVPILIDTTGNEAQNTFGAGANSAYVINRDGVIVARQQWFEPNALRRSIDEATKSAPTTKPVE